MQPYLNWREMIQIAPDVKAVNALMRDYAETLQPVFATLPEPCRAALSGELDVQAAAVALLQAELCLADNAESRPLVHEIAYIFASAAVRITLLHTKPVVSA